MRAGRILNHPPGLNERMELSIVIPAHNEGENLEPLIEEIFTREGPSIDLEVILVDDCSTDDTGERVARLQFRYPALRFFRHSERVGKSAALRTGGLQARGRWIATIDGDGQNDPRDIPRLMSRGAVDEGLVMISGIRRERRDSWLRRLVSRYANWLRRLVLRDGCPDSACGLKLIRRESFVSLPYFDGMHRFLPALVRAQGGKVASLEVEDRPRFHGASKYSNGSRAVSGAADLAGVYWLVRRAGSKTPAAEIRRPGEVARRAS